MKKGEYNVEREVELEGDFPQLELAFYMSKRYCCCSCCYCIVVPVAHFYDRRVGTKNVNDFCCKLRFYGYM